MMPFLRPTVLLGVLAVAAALVCAPEGAQAQRARCRVAEVTLAPPDGVVQAGATMALLATAYDAAGNPCEVTYTWTSSDATIAAVDRGGIVRGVAPGTATITARTGIGAAAKIGRSTVTVESAGVTTQGAPSDEGIPDFHPRLPRATGPGVAAMDRQEEGTGLADNLQVDPLALMMVRGETRWLAFRANRPDGSRAQPVPIVFQVGAGGDRIIAVDTLGKITAGNEIGTTTVSLTVPNQSRIPQKTVRVEVRNDSVQFDRRSLVLEPNQVETLSVYVPAQQKALEPRMFQYESSDSSKVRINPGLPIVTALAAGTARITARHGILPEFSATVIVHRRVRGVTLAPVDRTIGPDSTIIIPIGGQVTLRARALATQDGTDVPEAPINWRSPDSTVVSLDTAHVVRGLHAGNAIVDVWTPLGGDLTAAARVRIRVVAGGLATARTRIGMAMGERLPLEVSILDERRNVVGSANAYITWQSSGDSIAKVEGQNQIVALRPGHAQLRGRTTPGWDSTITVDVFVGGEMAAIVRHAGRFDLTMLWGNGASSMALTHDSLVEAYPSWAPDGTRLAYTTPSVMGRTQTSTLWAINIDGSEPVALTDDSALVKWPTWVRGSNRIVFEWSRGGRAQVWLYESAAAGGRGTTHQITTGAWANLSPTVSPDGTRIGYVSARETGPGRSAYGLYTAALDGTEERLVLTVPSGHGIEEPRFGTDGRTILFLRREPGRPPSQRVWRATVTPQPGDTAVAVTPHGAYVQDFSPSVDGATLALTVLEPAPNNQTTRRVMLFSVAAGTMSPLASAPEDQVVSPALRPATPAAPAAPAPAR